VQIAIMPEAHCRSMLIPDTELGKPAATPCSAADVIARCPLLHGTTHHHIVDFAGFNTSPAHRFRNDMPT
jgi:hypothetical protein